MKPWPPLNHDEGCRQRLESLERFIADNSPMGVLYYCAAHNIHYDNRTGANIDINVSSFAASYECPVAVYLRIDRGGETADECKITGTHSVATHTRRFT